MGKNQKRKSRQGNWRVATAQECGESRYAAFPREPLSCILSAFFFFIFHAAISFFYFNFSFPNSSSNIIPSLPPFFFPVIFTCFLANVGSAGRKRLTSSTLLSYPFRSRTLEHSHNGRQTHSHTFSSHPLILGGWSISRSIRLGCASFIRELLYLQRCVPPPSPSTARVPRKVFSMQTECRWLT
ncbi:uncharacterized protein BO88DRAFT_134081 [Aspergillus vadensis CBS 113365]|uniref:Transmembrane protein n=1 Tax=Aspergillus vadensis (strain CBS 113365 / IMI 142717 / IBT 24658) TaxID=1448311 RepID=A0A319CAF8_ASPVC|nr:hypothetical protein BO88DRAFT_134081 [Aspergillus vadensis CBS 113365]PYH65622.1 hypothetical protein BO88DRAFT_134081 [Aspergillus vadensis CBS 113365]